MKLLYCIDERGLTGGAHLATELMIAALQKRGHTVDVMQAIPRDSFWGIVARAYARVVSILHLRLHLHLSPSPLFLRDPFGFKFRQMKCYDTVCVMSENSVFPPIVARLPPNVRKVQLIHTNYPMWAKLKGRDIAADGKLFVQFDCIACVGTIGAKQFEEMFPECKGKVVPFHNIIEVEREGVRGRACDPSRAAIDATTNDALNPDFDRRAMAEKKVSEWLDGVDAATFEAALRKLVEEKAAAGEYVFENQGDLNKALVAAKNFFDGYSRRIVELSDGRFVYFAPDPRSRLRNADNSSCWAEYAFHAVSSGGDKIPGKNYNFRKYNEYKVINTDLIESTLKSERCVPVLRAKRSQDAIKFFGTAHLGGLFDVVVRLDEYGNAEANMTEVTFETSTKRGQKRLPQLVSLTGAIRTVVSHQTATGTYPPNKNSIANPPSPRKGGNDNSALQLQLETTTKSDNSTVQPSTFNLQPHSPVRLISLARINDTVAKDGPRMIRVAKRLKDAGIDFVWDNYGGSGNGLVACQQEVERLGLGDVFRIHPFDPNARAKIAEADIFVLLSHYEGLPNVIYEARMMGLPVFATSVGGIPEQIEDGRTGWLVEDDEEAIVKRLISILGHSAEGIIRPGPLQYDNEAIVRQTEEFLTCLK